MSNTRKTKTRRLATKLGISYQAADNLLRRGRNQNDEPKRLAELLAGLRTGSPFGVLIGRVTAQGASTLEVARQNADDLFRNPKWYAETGTIQMTISKRDHELLLKHGAAHDERIQVIRSFHHDRLTFSGRCKGVRDDSLRHCRRFIWCGSEERESACVCGHTYRVVFDLANVNRWQAPQGRLCMDCGTRPEFEPVAKPRVAWRVVNTWQWQCPRCVAASVAEPTPALFQD